MRRSVTGCVPNFKVKSKSLKIKDGRKGKQKLPDNVKTFYGEEERVSTGKITKEYMKKRKIPVISK